VSGRRVFSHTVLARLTGVLLVGEDVVQQRDEELDVVGDELGQVHITQRAHHEHLLEVAL
jgi:hypothetical protein